MFLNLSLGTQQQIYSTGGRRGRPERGRRRSNRWRKRPGERRQEWRKRSRAEKSDTETEAVGGEVGPSQYKKGHMTNIYLTNSDKEAIVDHKDLYNKTNEHFKDKARKRCL